MKNTITLLMKGLAPRKYAGQESDKAEHMFAGFMENGFDYDEMSNHPDYLGYASAELLIILLPKMIDNMIRRGDTINYLIYPMMAAIDPLSSRIDIYEDRAKTIMGLADKTFAQSVCRFLEALKANPPNSLEQIERLLAFWRDKAEEDDCN